MLFAALFLCLIGHIYSKGFSYSANQKYSYVGKVSVDVSNWSTTNYQISNPSSLISNDQSKLTAITSLGDLQIKNLGLQGINIFCYLQQLKQTSMVFKVQSNFTSNIKKLSIKYIIVEQNGLINNFRFYNIPLNNSGNGYDFSKASTTTFIGSYQISQLNFTGGVSSVVFISGMNAKSTSPGFLTILTTDATQSMEIQVTSQIKSQTLVQIQISCPSKNTMLSSILVSVIVYNKGFSDYSFSYLFIDGFIELKTSSSNSLKSSNYQMEYFNTFIGLSGFKILNQNTFSFSQLVSSNKISISSNNIFDYAEFRYFVILTSYCSYNVPYLEPKTQYCYSKCPGTTTYNIKSLECQCLVNGTIVDNSVCIYQSTSETSSKLGLILGISIGVAVLLLTIILIYKLKDNKEPSVIETPGSSQEIRKIIPFGKEKPEMVASIDFKIIEKPVYYNFQSNINKENRQIHHPHKLESKNNDLIWIQADQQHPLHQLCQICKQSKKVFFKNSCTHFFHLECIGNSKSSSCPVSECGRSIKQQGIFYCNSCSKKYRKIIINSESFQEIKTLCQDCQNISL